MIICLGASKQGDAVATEPQAVTVRDQAGQRDRERGESGTAGGNRPRSDDRGAGHQHWVRIRRRGRRRPRRRMSRHLERQEHRVHTRHRRRGSGVSIKSLKTFSRYYI